MGSGKKIIRQTDQIMNIFIIFVHDKGENDDLR